MDVAAPSRDAVLDRLVALNGGRDAVRAFFSQFSDADLRDELATAEKAMSEQRRVGSRLGAIWAETPFEVAAEGGRDDDQP